MRCPKCKDKDFHAIVRGDILTNTTRECFSCDYVEKVDSVFAENIIYKSKNESKFKVKKKHNEYASKKNFRNLKHLNSTHL